MPLQLSKSVFVHIPKCGGRWATQALLQNCHAHHIGDPIYDAHMSPETNLPVFCVVREPALFAHSLWHHRARKKTNKYGASFNWQSYLKLERECQSESYLKFMENVANCNDAVTDYYRHYVGKYSDLHVAKMESLAEDLVNILSKLGEIHNAKGILQGAEFRVGEGHYSTQVPIELRNEINQANRDFCLNFGYL